MKPVTSFTKRAFTLGAMTVLSAGAVLAAPEAQAITLNFDKASDDTDLLTGTGQTIGAYQGLNSNQLKTYTDADGDWVGDHNDRINIDSLYESFQPFADYGVLLSTRNNSNKSLMLYDSNCDGPGLPACTGGDPDLATGAGFGTAPQGNVLMIQENYGSGGNNRRTNPDDWGSRAEKWIVFDFTADSGVKFDAIDLLDLDDGSDPKFKFTDADGDEQEFTFANSDPAVTLQNPGNPKDNSLRTYDFNSVTPTNSNFDFGNVKQLMVSLPGSGAISRLQFNEEPPAPKIPEPAAGLGLVVFGAVASRLKRKQKSSDA